MQNEPVANHFNDFGNYNENNNTGGSITNEFDTWLWNTNFSNTELFY